jgi:trigger factor
MNFTKIDTGDLTATLKIEITESDYAQKVENELKKMAREASIPGFRPGKVPVGMIKKRFGTSVLLDVINKILSEAINDFVKNSEKEIFGEPVTSVDQKPMDFETQKDFEFLFSIAYLPDVNIDLNKDIGLDYLKVKPSEEIIDRFISDKRLELGKYKEAEAVEMGDRIGFDISQLDEAGNELENGDVNYVLYEVSAIHDKDTMNSILGAKMDDVIKIDALPFFGTIENAAQVTHFDKEVFEHNKSGFRIQIINIERKSPAEMDKDFLGKIFPDEELADEQQLREKVAGLMENMYQGDSDHLLVLDAKEYLIGNSGIETPDEFIKWRIITDKESNVTAEGVERDYPGIRKQLINELIDAHLTEKYSELRVTGDDLKREMELRMLSQIAPAGNSDENMAGIQQFARSFAEQWFKDEKNKDEVRQQQKFLYFNRLAKLLKSRVTLNIKEVTIEELKDYYIEKHSDGPRQAALETPAEQDVGQPEAVGEQSENSAPKNDEQ